MRRGRRGGWSSGENAGAVRLARHRAASRRARISELEGRAAAPARRRYVEVERSEELKWTMAGSRSIRPEARILASASSPPIRNAKVGILYQNDDFGRDFLGPFKKVLADAGGTAKVIMEQSYDLTEPTVKFAAHRTSPSPAPTCSTISRPARRRRGSRSARSRSWMEAAAPAVRGLDGRWIAQRRGS